jgi:hypothetical protein
MSRNHLREVRAGPAAASSSRSTACIISGALTFLQKVSMLFATAESYTIDLLSCLDDAPRALNVSEWSKVLDSVAIEN